MRGSHSSCSADQQIDPVSFSGGFSGRSISAWRRMRQPRLFAGRPINRPTPGPLRSSWLQSRESERYSNMLKFAQWYDEHHGAHEGYKGTVPRHHRANVFVLHVTRQQAEVRKN